MSRSILIVEDEAIIAHEIAYIVKDLGYQVAGIASNSNDALDLFANRNVDLVLLDISLKGSKNGIDLAFIIREKYSFPFIFLTSHSDKQTINRVKETMPYGYILKPFTESEISTNIQLALHKAEIEKQHHHFPSRDHFQTNSFETISSREYHIIKLLCEAKSYQDIADELYVSHNTVKSHTKNIYRKLNIHSKYELLNLVASFNK